MDRTSNTGSPHRSAALSPTRHGLCAIAGWAIAAALVFGPKVGGDLLSPILEKRHAVKLLQSMPEEDMRACLAKYGAREKVRDQDYSIVNTTKCHSEDNEDGARFYSFSSTGSTNQGAVNIDIEAWPASDPDVEITTVWIQAKGLGQRTDTTQIVLNKDGKVLNAYSIITGYSYRHDSSGFPKTNRVNPYTSAFNDVNMMTRELVPH